MSYRSGPTFKPPSVLVVRPQRAMTSLVFTLVGAGFIIGIFYSSTQEVVAHGVGTHLFGGLAAIAFGSIFLFVGLHGWLMRVEVSIWDDGMVSLSWTRWPFSNRVRYVKLTDVHDVVVESGDGTSKIVVQTAEGPIPLTSSSTSDNLNGKVAEMKTFLRLA